MVISLCDSSKFDKKQISHGFKTNFKTHHSVKGPACAYCTLNLYTRKVFQSVVVTTRMSRLTVDKLVL